VSLAVLFDTNVCVLGGDVGAKGWVLCTAVAVASLNFGVVVDDAYATWREWPARFQVWLVLDPDLQVTALHCHTNFLRNLPTLLHLNEMFEAHLKKCQNMILTNDS
jgi:hypothetical protein